LRHEAIGKASFAGESGPLTGKPMRQTVEQFLALVIILSCLASTGCAAGSSSPQTKTSDKSVVIIGSSAVRKLLDESIPPPLLVDVRIDKSAFDAGHIPQAVHIPLHLLKDNDPRLVSATAIIVYSGDPNDRLSTAATKKLLRYKFLVFEFRGGLAEWNRTRNPKPEPEPAPSPKS